MDNLNTISGHLDAIAVTVLLAGFILLILVLVIQWLAWIFGLGRFKNPAFDEKMRYVVSNFFVNIINDFRHLLALIVMAVFLVALLLAMLPGLIDGRFDEVVDGLQTAVAAMGGLVGSIIGYYFGEKASKKNLGIPDTESEPEPQEQTVPTSDGDTMRRPRKRKRDRE